MDRGKINKQNLMTKFYKRAFRIFDLEEFLIEAMTISKAVLLKPVIFLSRSFLVVSKYESYMRIMTSIIAVIYNTLTE